MKKLHFPSINFTYYLLYLLISIFYLKNLIFNISDSILGSEVGDGSLTIWIAYWPYLKLKSLILGESIGSYLDSNIFYGFKNAYSFSDMMPSLLPFVAILDLSFNNPILTINVIHIICITLLPCGSYLLGKELGFSKSASFVSGLVCSFTAFHNSQYLHFQLQFICLLPYGIAYLLKFLKRPKTYYLSIVLLILLFLAGSSIHIFIYFVFSIFLVVMIFIIYIYKFKKYNYLYYLGKKIFIYRNIFIIFSLGSMIVLNIYPFYSNMINYNFKRLKVETLVYSPIIGDLNSIGFDPLLYFFLLVSFLIPFLFRQFSKYDRDKRNGIYFLCILLYLLSLGAKKYYPYNLLFNYFPGFSGIRDSSRFLHLFWISFGVMIAFVLDTIKIKFSNQKMYYIFLYFLIIFELIQLFYRRPEISKFHIPDELKEIHKNYSNNKYDEPLLLVSRQTNVTSYTGIDALSQYLSIFHKKNLVGGYSGQYPYSLYMLRAAISLYLSGDSKWTKEEIKSLIKSSPTNSIVLYDVSEDYRVKLSQLDRSRGKISNSCPKNLMGEWRNIPQISTNYGLVLGYIPNLEFCINSYNKILDIKLYLKWIEEDKIEYIDEIYVNTPFYHHPSAPELLYNTEGFRKKGNYILKLYQEDFLLYTGRVIVR